MPVSKALFAFMLGALLACATISSGQESTITGRVLGKSDVQTVPDAPIQALVVAVPAAEFDSLLSALGRKEESTRHIINLRDTVDTGIDAYASGHDVSGEDGRYRIEGVEGGTYFLCLSGRTESQEKEPWPIIGCMRTEVPKAGTVEQNIYMQFGKVVAP